MSNSRKYIIELEQIEGTDLWKAVGANTLVFDENGIQNILTPLKEEENVNWLEVPVDTKIEVSEDEITWIRRHFATFEGGKVYAWNEGSTSFSAKGVTDWEFARLYKGGEA